MRRSWTLLLSLIACADSEPEPSQVQNTVTDSRYIGMREGPEGIPGVTQRGAGLIGSGETVEFAVSHVQDSTGQMLWLTELTHRDEAGRPHWIVRDVLPLPNIEPTSSLVYSSTCRLNGSNDPEIVAIARTSTAEFHTEITHAWRADRESKRFKAIDVKGIDCMNEGYGV
jgi:hypothetical protein